ncbi:MAG: WYL domain-containing protein [Phenylobacterium sp.]|uniref:helix-turn-helix transcriptional regulator n=1 Tax=Phenylobacterium sp. TaxID=1871053 RepID=UPI0025DDBCB4|nr:WYL domain-containing protein [Phenylobacterium sp.]MCA6300149.1 WYL domain-containing protein [Phenylobacterium sp.]
MRLDKATALLHLARRLAASAEGLALEEIAAEFGVDRRTAERMRDAVRDLFPQMEEIREGRAKRFRIPGGLDPFFETPTVEELADLALAAEAARRDGLQGRAENLVSLAGKVESRIRPGLRVRYAADVEALALTERIALRPGPRPACDPEVLRQLRTALLAMRQVRFDYSARGGAETVQRTVDPCGLLFGSVYYLVARRIGAPDPVLWRLDRMAGVEVLESPAQVPESFDMDAFARQSFGVFQEPAEDIVLRVRPGSADLARSFLFHPSQTFEPQPDGGLLLRLRTGGLLELCWHLFTWRGEIEILAPDRLKTLMAEEVSRFRFSEPDATNDQP